MKTRDEILTRAAYRLREHARQLRASHTACGRWVIDDRADQEARNKHDELLGLASDLLRIVHGTFEVKLRAT